MTKKSKAKKILIATVAIVVVLVAVDVAVSGYLVNYAIGRAGVPEMAAIATWKRSSSRPRGRKSA